MENSWNQILLEAPPGPDAAHFGFGTHLSQKKKNVKTTNGDGTLRVGTKSHYTAVVVQEFARRESQLPARLDLPRFRPPTAACGTLDLSANR